MNNFESKFKNKLVTSIIDSATEGIIVAKKSGVIVYSNTASNNMFKYRLGELDGMSIEELVPFQVRKEHSKQRESYQNKPEKKSMGMGRDLEGKKKNGTVFPVEISLTPVTIDDEMLVAALITDISERKLLEKRVHKLNATLEERVQEKIKEVRRTQHLYDAVARNYPNGTISVLDKNLNYIMVEGRELFELNITTEALKGSSYLKQLPEEVQEMVEGKLNLALKGESGDLELSHGGEFYRFDAVPLDDMDGGSKGVLVVEQNITAIRKALDKERDLNELKSRFVSMTSHEFRTPLSTISSSADLANQYYQRGSEDKAARHLNRIRESVKHMVSILDDYLSLEKSEGGSWNDTFEVIDFKAILASVISDQKKIIKPSQKIQFSYEITSSDKQIGLEMALKGIASNLISNASKYSDEGKTIKVVFSESDFSWSLRVEDQGIGINKDEQEQVFVQFFRSDRTNHIPGTGVGLDLVSKYVKALGGEISLESNEGVGSVFEAVWPKELEQKNKSW